MAFPFLEAVVGSMLLMYIFETYLALRQHSALKLPTLPKTLEGLISQEKFEKSRAYCLDRCHFRFVYQSVNILTDSAILLFKVLPWFWKKSGHFADLIGLNEENEILHTLPFLAGVLVWLEQTIWLFFSRRIIGFCVTAILAVAFMPAAILIVKTLEFSGWSSIYSIISLWVLSVFGPQFVLRPILMAPVCRQFSRLPEGQLRDKIETLVSSLKFPLNKLLVVNISRWSSHSNAYMIGFLNCKRIVLFDTLIQQFKNDEEIVALVAHELGHWKHNHVVYLIIANQIYTLLYIGGYTVVRNWSSLFQSFGFNSKPLIIALIIFMYATTPIQNLVYFAGNFLRRAFECQADAFAKKLGYASSFRACLVRLQEENLFAVNMDPWYSAYHSTHPTLVERLAAMGKPDEEECSAYIKIDEPKDNCV